MFSEQEKRIFGPYFDGSEQVYADPLVIQRRLFEATQGRFYLLMQESQTTPRTRDESERIAADAVALPASAAIVEAVRYAFELVPWDRKKGKGLTEEECIDLLDAYHEWLAKKNASTADSPTCSPPTPDSGTNAPTTPSGSACGSTSTGPVSNWPSESGAAMPSQ